MCFFVAAMVLLVALLTGALITPAHGNSQSFWTDFWAPDMLGWSIIDHDCSDRVFFVPPPGSAGERNALRAPATLCGTLHAERSRGFALFPGRIRPD
jgi:hypothetical protein